MALVVETGTGATDSNSFVTVEFADTYHSSRGNTAWASLATAAKEGALIRAADYLNNLSFRGIRFSEDQAMAFPRDGLVDNEGYVLSASAIPPKLRYAQCEAALREANSQSAMQPDLERGGAIKRKKTDVLETEWFDSAPEGTVYTIVKNLLKGLLKSGSNIEIVRS